MWCSSEKTALAAPLDYISITTEGPVIVVVKSLSTSVFSHPIQIQYVSYLPQLSNINVQLIILASGKAITVIEC